MANEKFNIGTNLDDSNRIELTAQGKKDLEAKLRDLIDIERPKVQEELAEARAQGDLSENAEYDAAKDKQAEIEAEIARIEDMLARAKVIRASASNDEVRTGSEVTYKKGSETKTITIVPEHEFDPFADTPKVGANSLFAKAIMGAKVGDEILITTDKQYKVVITKIS